MRYIKSPLIVLILFWSTGCLFLDEPEKDGESIRAEESMQRGFVQCGEDDVCQPGTHCADYDFGACFEGCVSQINCLEGEICFREKSTDRRGLCTPVKDVDVPEPAPLEPGYVACGRETCQPGTYCSIPQYNRCARGCVSNVNCADGEVCIHEHGTEDVGYCATAHPREDTSTEETPAEEPDPEEQEDMSPCCRDNDPCCG